MILVTGATGFVGAAVCDALRGQHDVRGTFAHASRAGVNVPLLRQELSADADWSRALDGVDKVVHCAGRAHVMREAAVDPIAEFRRVNVDGTVALARQAAAAGVRRFVYLSSLKALGEESAPGRPLTIADQPRPIDAYGISKWEAEQQLHEVARTTGMDVVIIRPPLVYGPGVKGNVLSLMRGIWKGWPLPLGGVTGNRRSMVGLANLVDLISTCLQHPEAVNQTFLVSDGHDLSTAEFARRIGLALHRPARLVPVPPTLITLGATVTGRRNVAAKLLGSLQVDDAPTRNMLGWSPPVSVDEQLARMAAHWRAEVAG